MEQYDYLREETYDVIAAIRNDNKLLKTVINAIKNDDKNLHIYIHDELYHNDKVTGDGHIGYTAFNFIAEEYLCHNFNLLNKAFDYFGYDKTAIMDALNRPKDCDVLIRCYMLPACVDKAIEKLKIYSKYLKYDLKK